MINDPRLRNAGLPSTMAYLCAALLCMQFLEPVALRADEPRINAENWVEIAVLFAATLLCTATGHAQQFSEWSAPVNLNNLKLSDGTTCPAVVNSSSVDSHAAISKDGLSLFFTSNRPGGFGGNDIWVTQRNSLDDCWQQPKNLGPVVNSVFNEGVPNLTTDGHWLYFNSNRLGGCGGGDLYVSHRQDAGDDFGWENPINLGCRINTPGFDQASPLHFEDEATGTHFLYFTSRSIGGGEDAFDIYVSTCTADLATCNTPNVWGPGIPVVALNSPFRDTRTAIRRRDGLEMILSSGRPGSLGSENCGFPRAPQRRTKTGCHQCPSTATRCPAVQPGIPRGRSSTPRLSTGRWPFLGTAPSFTFSRSALTCPASQVAGTCTAANAPSAQDRNSKCLMLVGKLNVELPGKTP